MSKNEQHDTPWELIESPRNLTVVDNGAHVVWQERKLTVPGNLERQRIRLRHIVACVNGCAGINPEIVREMLARLVEVAEIIERDGGVDLFSRCADSIKAVIAKAERTQDDATKEVSEEHEVNP